MSTRSKLGGVSREVLLRSWLLFFAWIGANVARYGFRHDVTWMWVVWLLGAGLTALLISRRHWLAGAVGFVTAGSLVCYLAVSWSPMFTWVFAAQVHPVAGDGVTWTDVGWTLFYGLQFCVPVAILVRHVKSRHRILLAFDETQPTPRRRWMPEASSYYLVTQR